jgi:hypothetical protein
MSTEAGPTRVVHEAGLSELSSAWAAPYSVEDVKPQTPDAGEDEWRGEKKKQK